MGAAGQDRDTIPKVPFLSSLTSARDLSGDPGTIRRTPMIRTSFTPALRSALLITLIAAAPGFADTAGEITLHVDADEIGRGLVHVETLMPVASRPLRLVYPRWGADWEMWNESVFDVTDLHAAGLPAMGGGLGNVE
jgi:hypothetical protein